MENKSIFIFNFYWLHIVLLLILGNQSGLSYSQQDSLRTETKEKKPAKMSIQYYKKANGSENVKVKVWYKEDKKNIPVENAVVNLYLDEVTKEGMMTNVITDSEGEGLFILADRFIKRAEGKHELTFIGRMSSEENFNETEEQITVKRSIIELSLEEEDSVKIIKATMFALSDSGKVPVPETEIKIAVKRLLSLLPLGEPVSTDEEGSVSVTCPADIPGDSVGYLEIVARVEEHDEFGTVEVAKKIQWGIPSIRVDDKHVRAFWSSRDKAPIPLIIISWIIIGGVWGTMVYLLLQLVRIKRLGKKEN